MVCHTIVEQQSSLRNVLDHESARRLDAELVVALLFEELVIHRDEVEDLVELLHINRLPAFVVCLAYERVQSLLCKMRLLFGWIADCETRRPASVVTGLPVPDSHRSDAF